MKKTALFLLLAACFVRPLYADDTASDVSGALDAAQESDELSADAPMSADSSQDRIEANDRLRIKVYKEKDLSGVFTVSKEGNISYPLLGDIHVEGLTGEELRAFLADSLGQDFIVNPQVQVDFIASTKKQISILGEVSKPGNYILSSNSTLVRFISQVGGFSPEAAADSVKVMRSDAEGKKTSFTVDVGEIMAGQKEDFKLEPGDLVYVERVQRQAKEAVEAAKEQVTVLGQVTRPGNYIFTPGQTLVRLIGQAGGFTAVASIGNVRIVRQTGNKVFYVDAGAILSGRANDVPLEANDLVVVQESLF
ncbi:MAG TPA: polysaccharide biosynthesis/export family protein [Candidatus Eisenbacteria bacterium]|jgi:polysaccharide export outer membrane protein|nr:polysaccharide biosynthesis/export family protein [Candidatus Eisenbacteria bacterium]